MLMPQYSLFSRRLQELSLRVFESGIKKGFTAANPVNNRLRIVETNIYESADYFLVLADIVPVFYLLGCGLTVSAFAFLLETFWHDFLINLNICNIFTRLKFFVRGSEVRRSLKVRVMQVVPKNREET